ncbi:MAG: SDR family oxidoreductase [Pseudomonadales bacterium]
MHLHCWRTPLNNPSVIVVTGGASGMGKAYALKHASESQLVAVVDQDKAQLQSLKEQRPEIQTYHCDVANNQQLVDTFASLVTELGQISRLVHCPAIMPTAYLASEDPEIVNRVMNINYGGTVNTVSAVLPSMLKQDYGEIIIFGSSGGYALVPECGAYCVSKAATNTYAEILIEENRASRVHIMLVCPPLVDTPLLQQPAATSNPQILIDSKQHKRFVSPQFIVDEIDKALSRGTRILRPGMEAKIMYILRRISPGLVWRLMRYANKST